MKLRFFIESHETNLPVLWNNSIRKNGAVTQEYSVAALFPFRKKSKSYITKGDCKIII